MSFEVKDSGKRVDYPSGMRRDVQDEKIDYTLLPSFMLDRWAEHMTKGAKKYGRHNWQLANSQEELDRFKASAMRHMMQWLSGQDDEDHASAVMFNISAYEFVKQKLGDAPNDGFTPIPAKTPNNKADYDLAREIAPVLNEASRLLAKGLRTVQQIFLLYWDERAFLPKSTGKVKDEDS